MLRAVVLLVLVYVSQGHESWICTANTDAIVTSSKHVETEDRLQALETQVQQLQQLLEHEESSFSTIQGLPQDCQEIYENGTRQDGVYSISPDGRCPFLVYCDMTHGGWTVIQNRVDDGESFYRDWNAYVAGFGDKKGSHWLGLEKIHRLTRDGTQIYFDMANYDGTKKYAHYQVFTVHGAATAYTMNVDSFGYEGSIKELLSYHNGKKFSTYNRDNDASGANCCKDYLDGGGWWYNDCYRLGNPNGVYGKREQGGIGYWDGEAIQIKQVQIRIKRMPGTCDAIKLSVSP